MHLDIAHTVYRHKVFDEFLCDPLRLSYRKLHCKKAVRIAAECLPVEEVAPAPYNLSYDKSLNSRVRHEPELKLLYLREYKKCENGRQHSSVYGKSSRPEIEYLKRMCAVIIPLKNDIVYSGTYYGCNQCVQCKINVIFISSYCSFFSSVTGVLFFSCTLLYITNAAANTISIMESTCEAAIPPNAFITSWSVLSPSMMNRPTP